MTRSSWWRVLTALLLAQAVPAAFMLPAEHVHPADGRHPSSHVHRHSALHDDLAGDDDHDHLDGLAVSHDDGDEGHVTWLPEVFIGQNTCALTFSPAVVATVQSTDPIITWTNAWRAATSARTHGPPRQPPSLRGPPTIPVQI